MVRCPSCQEVAFQAGVCRSCGWKPKRRPSAPPPPGTPIIQGAPAEPLPMEALTPLEPAALPPDALAPLPPDALTPLSSGEPVRLPTDSLMPIDDGIAMMPGLVPTGLAPTPVKPKPIEPEPASVEPEFAYQNCPKCLTAQPQPSPAFCERCGFKLKVVSRKARDEADSAKRCRDCGTKNSKERTICLNCGGRLPDLED